MSEFILKRDCFVTSITLATIKKLGLTALDMDPLLVRDAAESVFHIDKMPQRMFDKLNCGLTLLGTSAFTDTIEGFLSCTAVMNNLVLNADTAPFVTLEQCAWSVWEYTNLNGDITKENTPSETFSPDIIKYIQEVGKLNGVIKMPVWLKFAELPEQPMPDVSSDVSLFEQYMARQEDYITSLNGYVNAKQEKLTAELLELKKAGFIA